MTYNGMVVARPIHKLESLLFSTPDECAEMLHLELPEGKTLGEMLEEGHSRYLPDNPSRHTYKIRRVRDMRRCNYENH